MSEFEAGIEADLSGSWRSSSPPGCAWFRFGEGCFQPVLGAGWLKEISSVPCGVDGDVGHPPAREGHYSWHC